MINTVTNGRQAHELTRNILRLPQGVRDGTLNQGSESTRVSGEKFRDRETAGKRLAAELAERGLEQPLILGLPRGGVVVAAEVASALAVELGVIVAKKLEAPYQPELALGAVTADGSAYVDAVLAEEVGANQHYLLAEQRRQVAAAKQQQSDGAAYQLAGRAVVVVTDGLNTGASAIAAVRSVKSAGATRVIAATPVGPPEAIEKLRREAEDVVCLVAASSFLSVAQFYDDFHPIDDETVRGLLYPPAAPSF